jgi:hypothetical protein
MIDAAMTRDHQEVSTNIIYHYSTYGRAGIRKFKTLVEAITAAWIDLEFYDAWPRMITDGDKVLWKSGTNASESLSNFAKQCGMQPLT